MSTRESGSSTQSTGTSWMRKPRRSASTRSSVSKNQPSSSTSAAASRGHVGRIALKPHCASENPARRRGAQQQVVGARDGSRFGPRTTARRAPGGCRSRRRCGRTRAGRPAAGAPPGRSTGRRPCSRRRRRRSPTTLRAAPGRGPSASRWSAPHAASSGPAGRSPSVASVLALSAIAIRQANGKLVDEVAVQAANRAAQRRPARCGPGRRCRSAAWSLVDIVVPVYNEERRSSASIRRLHAFLTSDFPFSWRIMIADNASTDGTLAIARAARARARRRRGPAPRRKGRGRALRAAWSASDAEVRRLHGRRPLDRPRRAAAAGRAARLRPQRRRDRHPARARLAGRRAGRSAS